MHTYMKTSGYYYQMKQISEQRKLPLHDDKNDQEDIANPKCANANKRATKHVKQKVIELKGESDSCTIITSPL